MAKMGRPSKYKPEYCQVAIDFMRTGRTKTQLAVRLKVNLDSIYEWEKKHPDFSEALKDAERASQAFWEDILHRAALGIPFKYEDKDYKNYNPTLIIFLMKCRFRDTYGDQLNLSATDFEFKPLASLTSSAEDE